MSRIYLFKNYISNRFKDRTDFSEKKLKLEFNSYDRNYQEYLPKNKNANILEIGFGTGYYLKYLLAKGYKDIYGIELSDGETEFVKNKIFNKVECVESTEVFLNQHQSKYDFIYMSQVLEHIPKENTINLLNKIKKSLKNEGTLIINTPNIKNPFNIYVLGADFTHEFIFSPESLSQVCKVADFSNIKIFPFREENISWHGKITNIISPIMYFLIKIFTGLNRCYLSPSNIYSANIYCICKK